MHENTYSLRIQHPINPPYRDHYLYTPAPNLHHWRFFGPATMNPLNFSPRKIRFLQQKSAEFLVFFCPAQETTLQWGNASCSTPVCSLSCLAKKSCPNFIVYSSYRNGQDFFDTHELLRFHLLVTLDFV